MRKLIMLAVIALAVAAGPQLAAANAFIQPVLTWNEMALDTVRTERLGAFAAARVYAMVTIAMYDAVNGINVANGWSDRDEALVSSDQAPSYVSRRAATIAAAHAVLSALYPNLASLYNAQHDADLAALPLFGTTFVEEGRQWGANVGQQVVALRANDGSSPSETQPGDDAPGEFRADWGSAQYRNMTPFAIDDPVAYFSVGPPALSSAEYADALNEVKTLGNAAIPDANKEEIFRFWRGGGGSARPPGEWIKVALTVAPAHTFTTTVPASS